MLELQIHMREREREREREPTKLLIQPIIVNQTAIFDAPLLAMVLVWKDSYDRNLSNPCKVKK